MLSGANTSSDDLYRVLGVDRKATQKQIRKAFRKLSMAWHPDRNKSDSAHEKFAAVSRAYEVLSDIEHREYYDNVGSPYPAHAELEDAAQRLVVQVIGDMMDRAVNDPALLEVQYYDPVQQSKQALRESKQNIHTARNNLQSQISRYENMMKRARRRGNDEFAQSPVGQATSVKIAKLKHQYSVMVVDLKVHDRTLELLDEYSCPADQRPAITPTQMRNIKINFGTGGTNLSWPNG